jgi:putative DNA primase/helicase
MTTKINNIEYLDYYIEQEWSIFPCNPNEKFTTVGGGYKNGSSDFLKIYKWWEDSPSSNIGLVTGEVNNLVVVDIDVKDDTPGIESLSELEVECGKFDTLTVNTPSGGLHYYFSYPHGHSIKCSASKIKPGIDIRANGGHVVAPGSIIDGNYYKFVDKDKQVAELPHKLLELLTKATPVANTHNPSTLSTENIIDGVAQGGRNDSIFKYARMLRGNNTSYDIAENQVIVAARNCTPALPDSEAIQCLKSAWKYPPGYKKSDVGNANRLINKHGVNIRYIHEHKTWIYWSDGRWEFDKDGDIFRRAQDTILAIHTEVAETDHDTRSALSKFALRSENKKSLDNMIAIARTDKEVVMSQSDLDKDHYLLGVANGIVDLITGELRCSNRSDLITKRAHVTHSIDAKCPRWLKFINEIMDNDKELVDYLQKIVGYSLTGNTTEQKFFFLHGFGANGKSVFIETISNLLGDYSMQTPVSTLMTKATGAINNDVARLKGARFVAATETQEHSKFNESELKQLTGGDTITARFLHQEFFQFLPEFKLWISGNHKPVSGDGYGIWRRLILIPFNVKFAKKDRDNKLTEKLKQELPGVLNWAIAGCIKWQKEGLKTPDAIQSAISEYKSEMDTVQQWIDDCWETNSATDSEIKSTELYRSYINWAAQNGEYYKLTQNKLGRKLIERGVKTKRRSNGNHYLGIALKNNINFQKVRPLCR